MQAAKYGVCDCYCLRDCFIEGDDNPKQDASATLEKETIMGEQLLNPMDVAGKLKISRTTFYAIRPQLIARGLKTLKVGKNIKYLESSLDALIRKCVEEERPLV